MNHTPTAWVPLASRGQRILGPLAILVLNNNNYYSLFGNSPCCCVCGVLFVRCHWSCCWCWWLFCLVVALLQGGCVLLQWSFNGLPGGPNTPCFMIAMRVMGHSEGRPTCGSQRICELYGTLQLCGATIRLTHLAFVQIL